MKRKQILVIAALCALAVSGCKKKETIDISTLHTTEAVEKETIAETKTAETESAAVKETENTAVIQAEIKTEKVGSSSFEYPVISFMEDEAQQEKANALLRTNALSASAVWGDTPVTVKASVISLGRRRIAVSYKGTSEKGNFFYSNTVDLESLRNLGLGDVSDPYTVAGYIASGDYKLAEAVSDEAAIRAELNAEGKDTDYYYKLLQKSDFTGKWTEDPAPLSKSDWPRAFSYEDQGLVYVSLPVSEKLGGYVLIKYSPDNK